MRTWRWNTPDTAGGGRGGSSSTTQPSPPEVRSNWNNRAIKTAPTLCSHGRKARVEGGVLVGFIQYPNCGDTREHLRLSYFGATLHPVFLLAASSLPFHPPPKLRRRSWRGAQQSELLGHLSASGTLGSSYASWHLTPSHPPSLQPECLFENWTSNPGIFYSKPCHASSVPWSTVAAGPAPCLMPAPTSLPNIPSGPATLVSPCLGRSELPCGSNALRCAPTTPRSLGDLLLLLLSVSALP